MFDWLTDGIVDHLVSTYEGLFNGINNLVSVAETTPDTFINGVPWNAINTFSETIIKPVSWSILTLFLLLELANIMRRQDARGVDSMYFMGMAILKIGCAKLCMDNIDLIVGGIFQISSYIVTQTRASLTIGDVGQASQEMLESLQNAANDAGTLELIGTWLSSWLIGLINSVLDILCLVVIYLRFIEIFVFTGVGPLCVATFPSQEHNTIFKNWVKRIVAQAGHVVLIVICIYLYSVMISSPLSVGTGILGIFWTQVMYKILLVIAMFQTGGWAKSLANAT